MYKKRLIILSVILVILTTIAYSGLATNLAITGEATIRAVSDIRVTNIELDGAEGGAVEQYAPKHTKNKITTGFILPNNNSTISYTIEIKNKGDIDQAIYGLSTVSNNNGLHILINGEEINTALPLIIPYRTTREITITYTTNTPSNDVINAVSTFDFREVYYITYETKGGSQIQRQVKYQNVDINLTSERPTKTKYVFTGWTDEQNGTTVKYAPGDAYTLNQNKTLYAIYRQGEATFLPGYTTNVMFKQLANPTLENINYLTPDTNITSIQRYTSTPSASTLANAVKVSTDDSDIDIYAWYSNGTIYYYTLADNPYMNRDASHMFRNVQNLANIDLSTINTSRTAYMHAMFMDCSSLASIDLSNFNTSSLGTLVPDSAMSYMFSGCSSLMSINLSTFNTLRITNMQNLFDGCSSLTNITFGNNFNTSNVTDMQYMFHNCTSLTSLNVSNFNTQNVIYMTGMFSGSWQVYMSLRNIIGLNNFNTSKVISMQEMFYNCNQLTSIDISSFNTSNVTNMYLMFHGCTSLTTLNLSNFNTSKVENMSRMFCVCSSLTSIDISSFDMSLTSDILEMFYGTPLTSLKTPRVYPSNLTITLPNTLYDINGNGYSTLSTGNPTQTWIKLGYTVVFDKNHNSATGSMSNQIIQFDTATQLHTNAYTRSGYVFTGWNTASDGSGTAYLNGASVTSLAQANGTITLYAQWREGEATFVQGTDFNVAIKQLANPTVQNITYQYNDTNITSIENYTSVPSESTLSNAVVVSTQDSDYDIYVWFDNGTVYYYSEAINLYMNPTGTFMFVRLTKVTNIDLAAINTTKAYVMGGLFEACSSLETIDLSTFDTKNVLVMEYMFWGCTSLQSIIFGNNFDTSKVQSTWSMFDNASKLKILDISNFDMHSVTNVTNMFLNTTSIEQLKTPSNIPSGITIDLPKTMYDENGNAYTQLDSTSPTETWLRKAYTVTFDDDVLPSGYQRVEYIESTGTQYIDTGVYPKSTTKVEFDYALPEYNSGFNGWGSSGSQEAFMWGYDGTNIMAFVSNNWSHYNAPTNYKDHNRHKLVLESGSQKIDGYEFATSTIGNTAVAGQNMYLFATHVEWNNTPEYYTSERVYLVKIYDGNKLVRNFVPCINKTTNKAGLYDTVNGVFYGNNGTGDFDYSTINGISQKEVIVGQQYGTLPEPTREGYTFQGWNGKNMFNEEEILMAIDGATYTDKHYVFTYGNAHEKYQNGISQLSNFKLNTQYTLSVRGYMEYLATDHPALIIPFHYSDDSYDYNPVSSLTETNFVFTSSNTKNLDKIIMSYGSGGNKHAYISHIQLEEGSAATAYEPYYITSNTTVVQDKDHTLKAVWTPNTYTINYNGNGSTSGSTASSTHTYDIASNLTTNGFKKTGYKFIGWNTAADGSGTAYLDGASVTRAISSGSITLYAQWIEGTATFIQGSDFNIAIKQLANPTFEDVKITTVDTNITSFEKYTSIPNNTMLSNAEIVSTEDSDFDIYIWYSNGILYYYTEAINVYTYHFATHMFRELEGLTNVDLNNINTSNSTSFQEMFYNDVNLLSLDLSNFNTSSLTNIAWMVDGCNSLKILDLSNFDLSRVTAITNAFNRMRSLEQLKTPKVYTTDTSIVIGLPKTLYDENGNAYTQLDSTSPTEEWLRKAYTVTVNSNGGNIPSTTGWTGTGNTATKSVIYNQQYGTLPEPTRDGYTFAGWNGKNLIDVSNVTNSALIDNNDGTYSIWKNSSSDRYSEPIYVNIPLNTNVTFSWEVVDYNGTYSAPFQISGRYQDGTGFYVTGPSTRSFDKAIDYMVIYQENAMPVGTYTKFRNLMIEIGNSKTTYEPYYITSDTTVVQDKDHALTAKWIPNTYSIIFNKNHNDATGTMSNETMTYGKSKNLTTNTYKRYGYKFIGWNTKPDGSGTAYLDGVSVSNLTPTNNGTVTLYAQWVEGEATFIDGHIFNYMIKELAGTDTTNTSPRHNTVDYNITSIERTDTLPNGFVKSSNNTVSTSTSDFDIYAWYDNGTIYYYTEAINLYTNANAHSMFVSLYNVTNIDVSTFNTSRTTVMSQMFYGISKTTSLDLSNFDTSIVTTMRYMFIYSGIEKLDLSTFDMSNVSETFYMLRDMTSLEQIKTPSVIPSGITIDLPKIMYDENGNAYTQLTSSTPTQIWLRKAYTVTFDANGGNLIYDIDDKQETTLPASKYSITNGAVTVTALSNDGIAHTTIKVNLEANKTYIFNCTTYGTWGYSESSDTVEAYLLLNNQYNKYYPMNSNNNYEFTPDTTGTYWLRLDVNQSGQTHTFSNISVVEKGTTKEVIVGQQYGTLPTNPTREGYAFQGWNGKNLLNYNELLNSARSYGIQVDNNGNVSDNNPTVDPRTWSYQESNWKTTLKSGTYTLSIRFSTLATSQDAQNYSGAAIYDKNNTIIAWTGTFAGGLYNKDSVKLTFTLDAATDIGIMIKAMDGIYKIQLEEGNSATAWEPYYITSSTKVVQDKDHTLKAIWEPNTYTISYNANGGIGTMNNQMATYTQNVTLNANTFTKEGYNFSGWYTGFPERSSTLLIDDSNEYSSSSIWQWSNFKSYAVSAPFSEGDIYQLEFDAKGSGMLTTYFYGDTGYKPVIETLNSNGIENINEDGMSDTYLTSQYEHTTIKFILGSGGDNVTKYLLFRVFQGNSVYVKNIKFYKIQNDDTEYENQKTFTYDKTNDMTLYAKWQTKYITVTFNDNNGTNVDQQTLKYNHVYSEHGSFVTPTRAGYTFTGWNTAQDGTGTNITAGTIITNPNNHTLYAQWVANTYQITYDNNYQSNNSISDFYDLNYLNAEYSTTYTKDIVFDDEIGDYVVKLTIQSFSGSNQVWWYTHVTLANNNQHTWQYFVKSSREANSYYYIGAERGGKYGENVQYTTDWKKLSKTFTPTASGTTAFYIAAISDGLQVGDSIYIYGLSIEEGNNSGNQTIVNKTYGTTIGTLPIEPTRSGYQFDGWYTDPVGGTKVTTSTPVPSSDITYYAHWKKTATLTNLVQNGSFENGLTNWTKQNYIDQNIDYHIIDTTYKKYGNKSLSRIASPTGGTNYISQDISFIENHKYYYFKYAYTNSSTQQWMISDIANRSNSNLFGYIINSDNWVKMSRIYESSLTETHQISVNYGETTDITYVDGIGVVDLTAAFGAGNEPDKAWCDDNIDYFDGTTTINIRQ